MNSRERATHTRLAAVSRPLRLEEWVYDTELNLIYSGTPGGCTASVGDVAIHTDFVIYDGEGYRVAELAVNHESGDDYDPREVLHRTREYAAFFTHAPDDIAALLGATE